MRTLIVCLLLVLTILVSLPLVRADPFLAYFVLGQLISDQRQAPVAQNTLSLNPIYNTEYNGQFVGACPDPKVIVAANMRGTTLWWEPGDIGKRDILGFEITSASPSLPEKLGMYYKGLVATFPGEVNLKIGQNEVVSGNPRYAKWQIPVETEGLPQCLYLVKLRVWFTEHQASGFLRLDRKTVIRREETIGRFVVLDPDYMAKAVNDLQVQQALRYSFGLMAGPTQIGQLQLPVNPQVAAQLNQPPSLPAAQPALSQPVQKPEQEVNAGLKLSSFQGVIPLRNVLLSRFLPGKRFVFRHRDGRAGIEVIVLRVRGNLIEAKILKDAPILEDDQIFSREGS